MTVQTRRIARPWRNGESWTLLLGVLALWAFARILFPGTDGARLPGAWLPPCPLRATTGIPCPFCGVTTGTAWMARGDIAGAWRSNILSPFLMTASLALGAYVLVFRMIAGYALVIEPGRKARRCLWIAAGAAAAASWVVNLLRFT